MSSDSRCDELERNARKFHSEHPEVWRLFKLFTNQRIGMGFDHYSADAVMHRVRWETAAGAESGPGVFKINNNHVAFYARWFMELFPQYDGFFRIRVQTSEWRDSYGEHPE